VGQSTATGLQNAKKRTGSRGLASCVWSNSGWSKVAVCTIYLGGRVMKAKNNEMMEVRTNLLQCTLSKHDRIGQTWVLQSCCQMAGQKSWFNEGMANL